MKKKKLTNLALNKRVISNLNLDSIKGGNMPDSDPRSYRCSGHTQCGCNSGPQCDPEPIATCGCTAMTHDPCFEDTWRMCSKGPQC